jgi:flagellar hook-associated protein 2
MTISSIGVGSKLDLAGLLDQLTTAESQPLVDIQNQATSYTTKLSAYSQIQSALNVLKTAGDKLADPAFFQTVKAAVGDPDVLGATTTTNAPAGSYNINVTQLAQQQSLVSNGQLTTSVGVGNGTIKIQFGAITGGTLDPATGHYSGAGFTPDADRAATEITIDNNNNSLTGIRDAINKANAGVTASIVNDGSGTPYRLQLVSTKTGEKSSMKISVAGDPALENLVAFDPAGTQKMQQTAAAQDALLTVNNIAIRSAGNTVTDAIQGTTLTLNETGSTSLKMTTDTASITTAITAFVNAYNSLQKTADTLSNYDPDTKKASALTGDQTLRNLLTRVRQTLTTPQPGVNGSMKVLSEIGVSFQKDGTLALDTGKLADAMGKNPAGVAALFSSDDGSKTGYGKQVSALVDDVTSSSGMLTAATDGVNSTLDDLSDQYNAMQDRVNATIARYKDQFTALDVLVNSMNNTMTYLTQQFDAMNSGK